MFFIEEKSHQFYKPSKVWPYETEGKSAKGYIKIIICLW